VYRQFLPLKHVSIIKFGATEVQETSTGCTVAPLSLSSLFPACASGA